MNFVRAVSPADVHAGMTGDEIHSLFRYLERTRFSPSGVSERMEDLLRIADAGSPNHRVEIGR